MTSILRTTLDGKEQSEFLLISDTVDAPGSDLLRCYAEGLSQRVDQVHVLSADRDPELLKSSFCKDLQTKFVYHDFWSDPLGWNGSGDAVDSLHLNSDKDFASRIRSCLLPSIGKVGVVIGSLSGFLRYQSVERLSRCIKNLLEQSERNGFEVAQIIAALHSDLHSDLTLRAIHHLANTTVSLAYSSSGVARFAEAVHKRKSGKILRQKEKFFISDDFQLSVEVCKAEKKEMEVVTDSQVDPAANLTFNLSLKESERIAKENVELPYTIKAERHSIQGQVVGRGKIFYEPDDADDFDEEDPDDDLDI